MTTFPNPVSNELMADVNGNVVLTQTVSSTSNMNISSLNEGIYLLHLETAEGI